MGKAKQRGTYEERVQMAQERNVRMAGHVHKAPPEFQKFVADHGMQRTATRLIATGQMTIDGMKPKGVA